MAIYELEERIFYDGAMPVDVAQVENDSQEAQENFDAENSEPENLSIAPETEDTSSVEEAEGEASTQTFIDPSENLLTNSADPLEAALAALDDIQMPEGFEPAPNILIFSEGEDSQLAFNTQHPTSNTILIECDSDDTLDSVLQKLKDELGDRTPVNIGLSESVLQDINSSESAEFLNELSELQAIDGELNLLESGDSGLGNRDGEIQVYDIDNINNQWQINPDTGNDINLYFEFSNTQHSTPNTQHPTSDPESLTSNPEIVFLNSSVMNSEEIVDDLSENAEIVHLTQGEDGIQQITDYLAEKSGVDTVRIISHGNEGYFVLNGEVIDGDYLAENSEVISSWQNALSEDADIMLYGCNLAANSEGQDLVHSLAEMTGADVAAATFATGGEANWALDYQSGEIESVSLTIDGYDYQLENQLVTSNANNGTNTLRWAVGQADDGDEVTFDLEEGNERIILGSKISIYKDITIDGSNGDNPQIIVDGNDKTRIFAVYKDADVTIQNMTIQNGRYYLKGGGIYNRGNLTLKNTTITENTATSSEGGFGGGIYNKGVLTIDSSEISDNRACGGGYGYYGDVIYNSYGGGICNLGVLVITNSTIEGNVASGGETSGYGYGGGICNYSYSFYGDEFDFGPGPSEVAQLTIKDSTITDNHATGYGGGIYNYSYSAANHSDPSYSYSLSSSSSADLTIDNSEITGNSALNGGGIYNYSYSNSSCYYNMGLYYPNIKTTSTSSATLAISNSVISENEAKFNGGGIYNYCYVKAETLSDGHSSYHPLTNGTAIASGSANINLDNSEILDNTSSYGAGIYNYSRSFSGTTVEAGTYVVTNAELSADIVLNNSTISGNSTENSNYGYGGGIYNYASSTGYAGNAEFDVSVKHSSDITARNSSISDNEASYYGGGIYNRSSVGTSSADNAEFSAKLTLENSTMHGNSADRYGGGIYNDPSYSAVDFSEVTVVNSTITGNEASYGGGGVYLYYGNLYAANSIIAHNHSNFSSYSDIRLPYYNGNAYGYYNVSSFNDWSGNTNQYNQGYSQDSTPLFDGDEPVMTNNGGNTETVALAEDSIAEGNGVRTGTYVDNNGITKHVLNDGSGWVLLEDGKTSVDSDDVTEIHADQRGVLRDHSNPVVGAYIPAPELYQTKKSGSWDDPNNWLYSWNSGQSWFDAEVAPDAENSDKITVQDDHTITVDADVSIDQTVVESDGKIIVNEGVELNIADDEGADITIEGSLENNGSIVCNDATDVLYNSDDLQQVANGDYHNITFSGNGEKILVGDITVSGDWTNTGTFEANNHTVTFDGNTSQSITSGGSSFYGMQIANSLSLLDPLAATGSVDLLAGKTITTSSDVEFAGVTSGAGKIQADGGVFKYSYDGDQAVYNGTYDAVILSGGGTKTFSGTTTAYRGVTIDSSLTVAGSASDPATVQAHEEQGKAISSVFTVNSGNKVTIQDLTIQHGRAYLGGGIYNYGSSLSVDNSTISANSALYYGGGIYSYGDLDLNNSEISGNTASYSGGGICNFVRSLAVNNSTISGNTASYSGGGIYNFLGSLAVNSSEVSGNIAADGGGIYSYSGSLTLNNSTIGGNTAANGGGIYSLMGTLTVNCSTISGNTALNGGGIYNYYGTQAISNSVLSCNVASSSGGGVYNTGNLEVLNSEITENQANGATTNEGGGAIYNKGTVSLENSVVSENTAINSGGGIYNANSITLSNSQINANTAFNGGGVYNEGGILRVENGTNVSNNTAGNAGGGIHNYSSGTSSELLISDSTISGNSAAVFGGGIYNYSYSNEDGVVSSGDIEVTNSVISKNTAGSAGGGIYNYSGSYLLGTGEAFSSANLSIVNSTISENVAKMAGGGIYNYSFAYSYFTASTSSSADLELINSTVSENKVTGAFYASGGGIYNYSYSYALSSSVGFIVENSTISGNEAMGSHYSYGGGIYTGGNGTFVVNNSTISGNAAVASYYSSGGGVFDGGFGNKTVINSTITGNSAFTGAGIYTYGNGLTLTNSIIAYNYKADHSGYEDIYCPYSAVYGNYNISSFDNWADGEAVNHNYFNENGKAKPLFAEYNEASTGNNHFPVLAEGSIAAGNGVRTGYYEEDGATKYAFDKGDGWQAVESGTLVTAAPVTEIDVDQIGNARNSNTPCVGAIYAEPSNNSAYDGINDGTQLKTRTLMDTDLGEVENVNPQPVVEIAEENVQDGEYSIQGEKLEFDSESTEGPKVSFDFEDSELIDFEAIAAYSKKNPLFMTDLDKILESI